MVEDWDGGIDFSQPRDIPTFEEGGRSYGKGRGFIPHNNNDDEWAVGKKNNTGNDNFDYSNFEDNSNATWEDKREDRSHFRDSGRDRRGGRGGGYGKNSYSNDTNFDDNFEDNDRSHFANDEDRNDRSSRERGGRRGGGGGGGGGGRGRSNSTREPSDKPKAQTYIPPDEPSDEATIFGDGVQVGINFDKYDEIEIKVSGDNTPRPIESFEQAGLRSLVLENITKSGYKKPTPVQKHALPIIMSGRDLMACAQTGSGKTAAFAVPIINTLLDDPRDLVVTSSHCEPQVVIVSPTRELTIQIWQQVVKFSLHSILKTVVAYGGTSVQHQGGKLSKGCHILVATPGRLLDFLGRGRITFSSVRFLVLDEADRMLDMGFLPDIERIVDHETMVPSGERQTLMFSATFPDEIQHLAGRFLHNYLFLAVGIVGGACTDVEQSFYEVTKYKKKEMLREIVEREQESNQLRGTLVFVEMKRTADFIAAFLSENDYPTTSIHGDRMQREREEALNDFKEGRMSILVATPVAARGLDIKNVIHVINYDMPKGIDEYVHRIGRTGRVGNRGRATSFFDPVADAPLTIDLVRILRQARQSVPEWLIGGGGSRTFAPGRARRFGGEDVRNFEEEPQPYGDEAYAPQEPLEPKEDW